MSQGLQLSDELELEELDELDELESHFFFELELDSDSDSDSHFFVEELLDELDDGLLQHAFDMKMEFEFRWPFVFLIGENFFRKIHVVDLHRISMKIHHDND